MSANERIGGLPAAVDGPGAPRGRRQALSVRRISANGAKGLLELVRERPLQHDIGLLPAALGIHVTGGIWDDNGQACAPARPFSQFWPSRHNDLQKGALFDEDRKSTRLNSSHLVIS